jgi:hypothetical protein
MDALTNPFQPGAGTPPPELAGRDELLRTLHVTLARILAGYQERGALLVGLRGVGKTVLLRRVLEMAQALKYRVIRIEASEKGDFLERLVSELKVALIELSLKAKARDGALRALSMLVEVAKAFRLSYGDVQMSLQSPAVNLPQVGADLDYHMRALLHQVAQAAQADESGIVILIDELQYLQDRELSALIMSLHAAIQDRLPILLIGAGLPSLRERTGKAKSYAERMFEFPEIGPLDVAACRRALRRPVEQAGAAITEEALERIIDETQGYPYFLQEWGKHAWDVASRSPIDLGDVINAEAITKERLDRDFFRVRFDRLTPFERTYLRAMAELPGIGPHRTGAVATILGRTPTSLGPVRSKLLAKGMIWSPAHGDIAFTVPLFDRFMKRMMPDSDWREF